MNDAAHHRAAVFFLPACEIASITPLGSGNVNDTYLVTVLDGKRLVLQRLNSAVFPDPGLIMENMRLVTSCLHERPQKDDQPEIHFPRLVAGKDGDVFVDREGAHWRMLSYIRKSRTLHSVRKTSEATAIGTMLGYVHHLLSRLDPAALRDPLPGFHVTPRYLRQYDTALENASPQTAEEEFCLQCIASWRNKAALLEEARHMLRAQVIHADPKVANFLFAENADRIISLIDLDTVGPGLLLHDLGDCLRSCCNRQGEEISDPASIRFDGDMLQAVLAGYLGKADHLLGKEDRELLIDAVRLITFELGLRFFSDHLAGDRYFKVRTAGQNLHRALVQFHLVRSIDGQRGRLDSLVAAAL